MDNSANPEKWWARGMILEQCNCQFVCPAHFSFKQLCTQDPCIGHWSFHIEEGAFGKTALNNLNLVIIYYTPQLMISGNWTEALYIDERADPDQRLAIEKIVTGQAGGPWKILSRFVAKRIETRFVPVHYEDQGRLKSMRVEGYFATALEPLKGMEKGRDVYLDNLFNHIHAPIQTVASGSTRWEDSGLSLDTEGTHALISPFSWSN